MLRFCEGKLALTPKGFAQKVKPTSVETVHLNDKWIISSLFSWILLNLKCMNWRYWEDRFLMCFHFSLSITVYSIASIIQLFILKKGGGGVKPPHGVMATLHSLTGFLGWVTPCDLLPNLLNSKKRELILGHKIQYGYHPGVQLKHILESFFCNGLPHRFETEHFFWWRVCHAQLVKRYRCEKGARWWVCSEKKGNVLVALDGVCSHRRLRVRKWNWGLLWDS